ncbi:MAG: hypothetical protein ABW277_15175 [Longimicrobiaceae bacterium]
MNRKLLINGISLAVILVAAPLALTPSEGLANAAGGGTCCSGSGTCVVSGPAGFYSQSNSYYSEGRC